MKIEELLSARYEVIANYPRSLYEVGHIIHESENLEGKVFFTTEVQKYPHLFKKLDWFKDRKESEMPQYLKFVYNDKIDEVRYVKDWLYHNEDKKSGIINGFTHESDYSTTNYPLFLRVSLNGWLPATENECRQFNEKRYLKKLNNR